MFSRAIIPGHNIDYQATWTTLRTYLTHPVTRTIRNSHRIPQTRRYTKRTQSCWHRQHVDTPLCTSATVRGTARHLPTRALSVSPETKASAWCSPIVRPLYCLFSLVCSARIRRSRVSLYLIFNRRLGSRFMYKCAIWWTEAYKKKSVFFCGWCW